ncbi:MAG TPA: pirin family protein [Bacteroidales bacterium]|nr:pirin family protein [Bacteroidales bacterium]
MKTIIHRAETRGHANLGWLDTYHTFSFADYFNKERIQFGALRVLNDDLVEGGRGFGSHPHDNMEIVTIMLGGELKHSDSMGHTQVLHEHEVQAMSAGTGIFHSEMNNLPDKPVRLLQLWVFPQERNIEPRYEQKNFDPQLRKDRWQLLAGPDPKTGEMELKQKAWFSRIDLEKGNNTLYDLYDKDNGVYLFVIDGRIKVDNELQLTRRDGAGLWEAGKVSLFAEERADILAVEVPVLNF